MYRRDYILGLIEKAAVAVYKVAAARRNAQFEEAMALLNQAMKQLLGMNSKLIGALSVKDLLAMFSQDGGIDQGKVLAAGDLLHAEASVWKEAGNETAARQTALKCVEMLLTAMELDARSELKNEFDERLNHALDMAGRAPKSAELLEKLIPYCNEAGKLADAEDVLFQWLDELEKSGQWERRLKAIDEGIRMCEQWLQLDEGKISAGGLSSAEIHSTLQDLIKMKANSQT
ncbi:DUF6483 family protein [Paenibacillus allorhizosphaerae]|uniref:Uncharacterized protein n=1 Tax=Paenibacillus allorhizosphaerae TaxID=2849866 RepID=A0ABN7TLR4_9BACL|nr:DUF6483 family protein [Paenibacillus allorhizosphaerae]CAG7645895.1 hypothetical protein PAECIP111802_03631 [Paenibacillus allorhizosphaerae]